MLTILIDIRVNYCNTRITKLIGPICGDSKLWLMRGFSNC